MHSNGRRLNVTVMAWGGRRKLGRARPDMIQFFWLPRIEFKRFVVEFAPLRPAEYTLWLLWGWGGIIFDFSEAAR